MVGWLKALLFVVGGVTAAAGTAYVTGLLDPWLGREQTVIAALPQTPAAPQREGAPPAEDEAAEAVPLPDEPTMTEKQDRLVAPSFDLLRVEPDGSVVIAGKAAGGATVEVLAGELALGSAQAGAEGDFVIVLDDPLAPGDYQLSLRAISGDVVSISPETAVVSVPESPDGQVLALVEAPGVAAELITVPEAPAEAAAPEPRPAEEEAVAEAPAEPVEEPAQEEVAAAPEPAAGEEVVEAPAAEPAEEEQIAAVAEPEAAIEEEEAAAPAPTEAAEAEEEAPAETVIAAAPAPQDEPEAAQPPPAQMHRVVVEAVEIEGETVFVAGHADPGRPVRVYANEILLGDERAAENGRFLIEARRGLPVGDYLIRADLLDADGSVLARAAVPFEREPGETIAAVAPSAQQPQDEEEATAEAPAPETGEQVAAAPEEPAQETAEAPAAAPEQDSAVTPQEDVAAAPEAGEAEAEVALAPEPAAAQPEATAPALQRVDGSVIIRRGDNLWRISRRVYGHGVRYSTIYLANQDQIRNPDMIWPGQVFTVPRETPEGEVADMEAIGDQAVIPETDAEPAAQ